MRARTLVSLLAAPLALAACDDSTGPGGEGQVAVRFGVGRAQSSLAPASASASASAADQLAISGSNGTLVITDLRLILAEFELDGEDDNVSCTGDDCEDFRTGPRFVDVPLEGGLVNVAEGGIPAGTYRELEFEVEDLDDDEEDPVERQQIEQLRQAILAQIPDWPRDASMLVTGTFTPTGGSPRPFRVFFEAEIEVELDLVPPLVVTSSGANETITITLNPVDWFLNNGQVLDLSRFNGRLVELEVEIENDVRTGFRAKVDD